MVSGTMAAQIASGNSETSLRRTDPQKTFVNVLCKLWNPREVESSRPRRASKKGKAENGDNISNKKVDSKTYNKAEDVEHKM